MLLSNTPSRASTTPPSRNALDIRDAAALREHLATCADCRCYRDEITTVSRTLSAATPASNLEPSASFYHGLSSKLVPFESTSGLADLFGQVLTSIWAWRLVLSGAALFIVISTLLVFQHPAPSSSARHSPSQAASEADPPPTIASYQIAASQSLEKFSDLLRREGEKPLPPIPPYSISSFEQANDPF